MQKLILTLILSFFSLLGYCQSCGTVTSWLYTISTSSTSGNSTYAGTVNLQSSGTGNKTVQYTISCGTTVVYTSACESTTPSGAIVTFSIDVPTCGSNLVLNYNGSNTGNCNGLGACSGTVTPTSTLPVELVTLDATIDDKILSVSWVTGSELNNAGFEVQILENNEWNVLQWVNGNGTTDAIKHYATSIDASLIPLNENLLIRLKQIDLDGKFEYSDVIKVKVLSENSDVIAFPNPVSGILNLSSKVDYAEVVDCFGNQVMTIGQGVYSLDVRELCAGLYFLHYINEGTKKTLRFVKD